MRRRVAALALGLCVGVLGGQAQARKVVVLGIDGMDPGLLTRFVAAGEMPHFARLMRDGDFRPLQTTVVPQSPVAWSTFITGMDPGGHGIYDFVHRDPASLLPFLSIARAYPPAHALSLGSWVLPLGRGGVELLRHGRAFWEVLGEHGVRTTLFRMPVTFPPVAAPLSRQLSGMGTPDIRGTPGTFLVYTSRPDADIGPVPGGEYLAVRVQQGRVQGLLPGPGNPYRRTLEDLGQQHPRPTQAPFEAEVDAQSRAARFRVGEHEFILVEGEWSDWVRIDFPLVGGLVETSAVARFHLQHVEPCFELYVTPLQINPEDPAMPVSTPSGWAGQLCACLGYFYTQGMPEDAEAFTQGALDGREFCQQVDLALQETRRIHAYLQDEHDDGLLFVYYGTLDQGCHMLWHYLDPEHPLHEADAYLAGAIGRLYGEMDRMLGEVLQHLDAQTTLVVMSDHGFAPFYWQVNLNTWLLENGYVVLREGAQQAQGTLFAGVDWGRTRAYALGLNGLYANLRGRERLGVVEPGAAHAELLAELEGRLLAWVDSETGRHVISRLTRPGLAFQGPHRDAGPDLLVGYDRGYRSSWASPLGEFPPGVLEPNDRRWSGDHCIDHTQVPGVLLSNRRITLAEPALPDLTVAILDEYGVGPQPGMIGKDCLEGP
ncbi:MAG: alkaline phosphatase family protein [Candidatus Latescibacterota bacterium]